MTIHTPWQTVRSWPLRTRTGELIVRYGLPHAGVIFFRLPAATVESKIGWLQRLFSDYADQLDQFIIVSQTGVRVRRTT